MYKGMTQFKDSVNRVRVSDVLPKPYKASENNSLDKLELDYVCLVKNATCIWQSNRSDSTIQQCKYPIFILLYNCQYLDQLGKGGYSDAFNLPLSMHTEPLLRDKQYKLLTRLWQKFFLMKMMKGVHQFLQAALPYYYCS